MVIFHIVMLVYQRVPTCCYWNTRPRVCSQEGRPSLFSRRRSGVRRGGVWFGWAVWPGWSMIDQAGKWMLGKLWVTSN
jgi:hypothetical protein